MKTEPRRKLPLSLGFQATIAELMAMRRNEGELLERVLRDRLSEIAALVRAR